MKKLVDITKASGSAKKLIAKEIAEDLKAGKTVIFPTETVYGLACDVKNNKAVEKIFEIKGRDKTKPLPVMIGKIEDINLLARDIPDIFYKIADKFMPGPITVVLKKKENISDIITGGLDTIGVRMPNHLFALNLIKELGNPIIATSANLSHNPSPVNAQMAKDDIGDLVDILIDDGDCKEKTPSTIIDISTNEIKILRQGSLDLTNFISENKI